MRDRIVSTCGDSDVIAGQSKKIDPCLRLYNGALAMCIYNARLKNDKIGNGTLCRVTSIKLKDDAPLMWKNWDGVKVYTVSARCVEHVEFEHFPENERIVLQSVHYNKKKMLVTNKKIVKGQRSW